MQRAGLGLTDDVGRFGGRGRGPVHERDTDTDFVLLILREILRVDHTVKVILMSATIDCDLFATYFGVIGPERFADRTLVCA